MKNICWYWSPFVRSRIFWRIFSPSFSLPHRQTRSEDGSSFFLGSVVWLSRSVSTAGPASLVSAV